MIPLSYNVQSLWARKTTTLATAMGIALVVFVLASSLMFSAGIGRTLTSSGASNEVLVLSRGAAAERSSFFPRDQVNTVAAAPGLKNDTSGNPLIIGEHVMEICRSKVGAEDLLSNVQVRGVSEKAFTIRPNVRIIQGRRPAPGANEAIIGKGVRGRFADLELGGHFDVYPHVPVTVVGVFDAGGSSFESEIWCTDETLSRSPNAKYILSSMTAVLDSPDAYEDFRKHVEDDKRLELQAVRIKDYYEKLSERSSSFIKALGWTTAILFSLGAMIGAAITMYAGVWQRRREIGTLQALGFSQFEVLTSFVLEAVLLASAGGIVGALASLVMTRIHISMVNFATWQEMTFSFSPEGNVLLIALLFGSAMGLVGGLFPAIRAAMTPPVDAMRGN